MSGIAADSTTVFHLAVAQHQYPPLLHCSSGYKSLYQSYQAYHEEACRHPNDNLAHHNQTQWQAHTHNPDTSDHEHCMDLA